MSNSSGGAARRYAEAAFAVAKARRELNAWQEDLATMERGLGAPEIQLALENPRVDDRRRIGIALSTAPKSASSERLNFLKLLALSRRTDLIGAIRREFDALVDESAGRAEVEVVVARPLGSADQADVRDSLTSRLGREARVNFRVDPEILGGVIIRQGDHVSDGSVRRRIEEMREHLLAS